MFQCPGCGEGPRGRGKSKVLHAVILHLVILSTSICGLQGHHKRGRRVKGMDSSQALGKLHYCQPLHWPRLSHLVWSNRAEVGKCSLPICSVGNWVGFGEPMELSPSLRYFNLILHFADGVPEGLRLGDLQQVPWWLGNHQDKNLISYCLTSLCGEKSEAEKEHRRVF